MLKDYITSRSDRDMRYRDETATLLRHLPARLKRMREAKEISQRQAAIRCGMSPQYYGKVENGVVNPTLPQLYIIVNGLELDARKLFRPIPSFEIKPREPQAPR